MNRRPEALAYVLVIALCFLALRLYWQSGA